MPESKALAAVKKWAPAAAVILALALGLSVIKSIRAGAAYAAEKAAFERSLRAGQREIATLTEEKAAWAERAAAFMAAADTEAARVAALEAQLTQADAENAALRSQIATMPDDQIVSEMRTRLALGATDIYRNASGVQFTMTAARANLAILYDADFSAVKVRDLTAIVDAHKAEAIRLRQTIAAQVEQIRLGDAVADQYQSLMVEYGRILKASERRARWLRFTIGGTAVAVTAAGLYFVLRKSK